MNKTPKQDISDAVQALPYEVFEIRHTYIIGGRKLPVVYVIIARTSEIQQAVAELKGEYSSYETILRYLCKAALVCIVYCMELTPDIQGMEEFRRQLIAECPPVLNQLDAPDGGNGTHYQNLMKHALEVDDSAALTYTVYEIVIKIVLGGKVLKVSYIGMTGQDVLQRMRAHLSQKAPGNGPLSHSLNSGADYELNIIDTKSNRKDAKAIERKHIASREWVFNKQHTSKSRNSVYDQYILEYKPEIWKKPR